MSMIDSQSKKMLVEAMRRDLAKAVMENKELTESAKTEGLNFVADSATYEQLLNLTFNPLRESKYLPSYVIEGAVAVVSSAIMTGRKVLGENALTHGGIRLEKMTGAVVTESMMDAALEICKAKNGVKVIGECLKESFAAQAAAAEEANKPTLSAKAQALKESVVVTEADGAKKDGVVKKVAKAVGNAVKKATGISNFQKASELKKAGKAAEAAKLGKKARTVAELAQRTAAGKTGVTEKQVEKAAKNAAKAAYKKAAAGRGKEILKGTGKAGATVAAAGALAYGAKKWHDKRKAAKDAK